MFKIHRAFLSLMAACLLVFSSLASAVTNVIVFASTKMAVAPVVAKLDIELAANAKEKSEKVTGNISIGSGSGDSPLNFVALLKAINSRSDAAFA